MGAEPEADAQYYYNGYFNNGYGHHNRGPQGYRNLFPTFSYERMWKRDAEAEPEAEAKAEPEADAQMMMFQPQAYGHFNQGFYGHPMSYGYNHNQMWKRDAEPKADADAQYYYS